jgi:hypothetical protein
MIFKRIFFVLVILLSSLCSISFSLEPRLFWKMEIIGQVKDVDFAKTSSNIIFSHGKEFPNTVTVLNKEGKIVWQWGPKLNKGVEFVSISDDGNYFTFNSYGEGECYGHYFNRTKGELWKKDMHCNSFVISPDGKYVLAQGSPESYDESFLLDSTGKILWQYKGGIQFNALFSPDSKYIAIPPFIVDIKGKIYFEKAWGFISSVSFNGEYFGIFDSEKEGIFSRNGNLVFAGKNIISLNGKIVLKIEKNKIEIYRFPEKIRIAEFPLSIKDYRYTKLSSDGKYILMFGSKDKIFKTNLFLLGLETNMVWEKELTNVNSNDSIRIFLSHDGKYFLVAHIKEDKSTFYFYQSY